MPILQTFFTGADRAQNPDAGKVYQDRKAKKLSLCQEPLCRKYTLIPAAEQKHTNQ
jgi:hypothetical protein